MKYLEHSHVSFFIQGDRLILDYFLCIVLTPHVELLNYLNNDGLFSLLSLYLTQLNKEIFVKTWSEKIPSWWRQVVKMVSE